MNSDWSVDILSNFKCYIKCIKSGKVMDVRDSTKEECGEIVQNTLDERESQKFVIDNVPNQPYHTITAVHSGYSVDVNEGSTKAKTKFIQYRYKGGNNQHFLIEYNSRNQYRVKSIHSNQFITNQTMEDGTVFYQYPFDGSEYQLFELIEA